MYIRYASVLVNSVSRMEHAHFCRSCSSKVKDWLIPKEPINLHVDKSLLPAPPIIDDNLIKSLEHQSLVRFTDKEAVYHLRKAIEYADQLCLVDTENVEPLYSLCEDMACPLREDVVTEGDCAEQILANASEKVENYFVAPPGNIPLHMKEPTDSATFYKKKKMITNE